MTVKVGLHGDRYDADVTEFFDSETPFVTFEVTATNVRTDYFNRLPDGTYRVNKNQTGTVSVFIRSVEDAMRIFEAARKLVGSLQDMEFETKLKEVLKNDIERFFKDGPEPV